MDILENKHSIKTILEDLSNPKIISGLVADYDLVINAVPGFMGFQTLKAIIEAGKNVIDIAFFPEDPFQLDELAKTKNVVAIVDCGVAPGMSNILTSYESNQFDKVDTALTYVGGLPEVRELPFEYKAVFSPIDVIEEYLRPARYIENGKIVIKEALSEPEALNFANIGTLIAFNTDGLRTLAKTLSIPNMKEKTLRYPGHIEKMKLLREIGMFSSDKIDVNGNKIRPIDVTAKLMFPKWKMEKGDRDLTVMRVIVKGVMGGKKKKIQYDLLDRYDEKTGIHSMARTTGYTATLAARMVANGLFTKTGLNAPETLGEYPACVKYMLDGLKERGVIYKKSTSNWED